MMIETGLIRGRIYLYVNCYQGIVMRIYINGQPYELEEKILLKVTLEQLNIDQNGLAVAINSTVAPKARWSDIALEENDSVMLIRATQGG